MHESLTDTNKDISRDITKTTTESSIKNNQAIETLNEKALEFMKDKGMIAPSLASSLVNLRKPENKSQFRLLKDRNSIRMNDFLINTRKPVLLYSITLTF